MSRCHRIVAVLAAAALVAVLVPVALRGQTTEPKAELPVLVPKLDLPLGRLLRDALTVLVGRLEQPHGPPAFHRAGPATATGQVVPLPAADPLGPPSRAVPITP